MYLTAGERSMVAIYLAAGEESMAAEVVHNNPGRLLLLLMIIMILYFYHTRPHSIATKNCIVQPVA